MNIGPAPLPQPALSRAPADVSLSCPCPVPRDPTTAVTHSAGTTPHQAKGGAPPGGWVHEGQHDGVAEGAAEAARKAAARKAAKALDTAAAVPQPASNAEAVAEPGGGAKRVAVLITVTKDMAQMDGAAVLAESVRLMNSKCVGSRLHTTAATTCHSCPTRVPSLPHPCPCALTAVPSSCEPLRRAPAALPPLHTPDTCRNLT